ncbi:MAG: flagellar basal body M-ring protein FliF [Gammaproteobacteria bacterium]|nr:flagellar basal body M-ring protein FliF [Gammaproteobacteria bacterium]
MAMVDVNNIVAQGKGFYQLPLLRQLGLMVGLAASVAIGVAAVTWSQSPDYRLLYSNLSEQDANQITQSLQQANIKYKLSEGTSVVMVAANDVSSARMMLAGQGLPKGGDAGFELLDKAEGFGVSQFMENTRYQRALEGELARTITSLDSVRSARVHLALPKQSAFIRQRKNPTASVTIDLLPGRFLGEIQVAAVRHIVSAGVPNLDPDNVMVIDQRGRLLTTPGKSTDLKISAGQFDYRERIENDYEKRIEEIISPIVGAGAVRAQVSADMDFTVTEKSQEQYDPKTASVRSEHIEEQQNTDGAPAAGVPGSLTNQPPSGGTVTAQNQSSVPGQNPNGEALQSSRTTIKNYELDKTISHVRQGGGVVNRLSIAVVVDFKAKKNEQGEVVREALPAEELSRIEALVKRAVGFDAARGDQVEVVNAPFNDSAPVVETPVEAPAFYERPELISWAKQGLAGLLVLYLLMGVLRPVMRSLAAASRAQQRAHSLDVVSNDQLSLSGPDGMPLPRVPENALPQVTFEDRLNTARGIASQDPKRVAQVVNNWLVTE